MESQPVLDILFLFCPVAPQHVKCLTKLRQGRGKYLQNTWQQQQPASQLVCLFCVLFSQFLCSPSVCEIAWNFKINISSQTFQKSYFIANNLNSPTDLADTRVRYNIVFRECWLLVVALYKWYQCGTLWCVVSVYQYRWMSGRERGRQGWSSRYV